jgi:hypothetical protein
LESTSVSPDYFTTLGIPIMSGRAFLESDAPPSNKAGCAAQKRDIYQAILGTSGRPVGIGLLLGLAITVATWSVMAPLLRDQEFSFNSAEPFAYAVTAGLRGRDRHADPRSAGDDGRSDGSIARRMRHWSVVRSQ